MLVYGTVEAAVDELGQTAQELRAHRRRSRSDLVLAKRNRASRAAGSRRRRCGGCRRCARRRLPRCARARRGRGDGVARRRRRKRALRAARSAVPRAIHPGPTSSPAVQRQEAGLDQRELARRIPRDHDAVHGGSRSRPARLPEHVRMARRQAASASSRSARSAKRDAALRREGRVVLETASKRRRRSTCPSWPASPVSSTAECVALAGVLPTRGCDGLMVLPPYVYSRRLARDEGALRGVISATPLSCMLYNNPIAYGTDVSPSRSSSWRATRESARGQGVERRRAAGHRLFARHRGDRLPSSSASMI